MHGTHSSSLYAVGLPEGDNRDEPAIQLADNPPTIAEIRATVSVYEKEASASTTSFSSSLVSDEQVARHGLEIDPESGYIRWRKDSRDHPRNWSAVRKTYDTSLVMFLEFYTWVQFTHITRPY